MNDLDILVEKVYKRHASRLLAVLTSIFGAHNYELAEEVLQDAFSKALVSWNQNAIPDNPSAWIIRVAKNLAIDTIRANKTKIKFSQELSLHLESEWSLGSTIELEFEETKIKDDQLRMIFMCCRENIKPENRIPFILKALCGFSIPAIARALLVPEETVKKRLFRTRKQLRGEKFHFPKLDELIYAMDTVHTVLYLLFNEGFHSSDRKNPINIEFCQEAIGLVNLLTDELRIVNQDTLGLFALMHFHIARIDSRVDSEGFNIPINLQDRSLWRKEYIYTANEILNFAHSVSPGASGRFLVEALIAREHCQATDFSQTNWDAIVVYYEKLIAITNSPVASLNHAIAAGYSGKLEYAIKQVETLKNHHAFRNSHIPLAVLAHLNAKAGNSKIVYELANQSRRLGGTPNEHRLMIQQLRRLLFKNNQSMI